MRKSKAATSDVADPEPEATPEAPRSDSVRTSLEALDGDRVKMTVSVDEAEFEQAVDRAYRIGQVRDVLVYILWKQIFDVFNSTVDHLAGQGRLFPA